jgi:hypothetical protein
VSHAEQTAAAAAAAGTPVRRGRKTTAVQQGAAAAAATPPGPATKPKPAAAEAAAAAATPAGRAKSRTRSATESKGGNSSGSGRNSPKVSMVQGPHTALTQPLPHVLILHTGGTLGMDAVQSFEVDPHEVPHHPPVLKKGTGGIYGGANCFPPPSALPCACQRTTQMSCLTAPVPVSCHDMAWLARC